MITLGPALLDSPGALYLKILNLIMCALSYVGKVASSQGLGIWTSLGINEQIGEASTLFATILTTFFASGTIASPSTGFTVIWDSK